MSGTDAGATQPRPEDAPGAFVPTSDDGGPRPAKARLVSKRRPPSAQSRWPVLLFLAVLTMAVLTALEATTGAARLEYSEFRDLVRAGKVAEVSIGAQQLTGTFTEPTAIPPRPRASKPPKPADNPDSAPKEGQASEAPKYERFSVFYYVNDLELIRFLEEHEVPRFEVQQDNSAMTQILLWGLLILMMLGGWFFILKRLSPQRQVMSFGRSKAKVAAEDEITVRFTDVAGIDEAKDELEELILFLGDPERFERLGARIPRGVLLVGSPGTGKTLLAKAVAGEAGVPFFSLSGSDFVEMFAGVGASRVRDLFEQSKKHAPCIIFIDELDAIGKVRGASLGSGPTDEREQTLNQLLSEMDGFETDAGVIILAATNRPEILDPALLRPGRFDRQVVVDRPDVRGRLAILEVHAAGVSCAEDVDLEQLARTTPGFVGADLANLVNEAALLAARRDAEAVEHRDFEEAIQRVVAGLEKRQRVMRPQEKRRIAFHETGHALVALAREHTDPVHRISIVSRGVAALGYTMQMPAEDRYLLTMAELEERIQVMLGGRCAERVAFGDLSTGASDDLRRAVELARRMVTEFGMTERFGPTAFGADRRSRFLDGADFGGPPREYSEATQQLIDEEIQRIIGEAESQVLELLESTKAALTSIAERLIEVETMDQGELLGVAVEAGARVHASKREAPSPSAGPGSGDE